MAHFLNIPTEIPALNPLVALPAQATPQAKALANMPSLQYWFDPDPNYLFTDANGRLQWKCRKSRKIFKSFHTAPNNVLPTQTTEIASKPTLTAVGTSRLLPDSAVNVNASAWSVFLIARADTTASRFFIGQYDNIAGAGDYGLTLGMTSGGDGTAGTLRIYKADGTFRLSSSNVVVADSANLIGFSYSPSEGLTIRLNGVELTNAADTNDLNLTAFQLMQNRTTTGSAFSGDMGPVMIFGDDYTKAENASYLTELEAILMTEYSL